MIKAIVDSCSFKSPKSDELRRVQVLAALVHGSTYVYKLTLMGASHPARGFAPGKLNDLSGLINKLV